MDLIYLVCVPVFTPKLRFLIYFSTLHKWTTTHQFSSSLDYWTVIIHSFFFVFKSWKVTYHPLRIIFHLSTRIFFYIKMQDNLTFNKIIVTTFWFVCFDFGIFNLLCPCTTKKKFLPLVLREDFKINIFQRWK